MHYYCLFSPITARHGVSIASMQSAVLAMIDSVRLSVTRWYHAKMTLARIMRSSIEDSPITLVSSRLTGRREWPNGSAE